jgi:predicted O-methyltransferase YrrM
MEPDPVVAYVDSLFDDEDEALAGILTRMESEGLPLISIGAPEGRFLKLMAEMVGASRALEIGTLAGYSGLWIVRGMRPDGRLITLESNPRHARIARSEFERAGEARRVEVREGSAIEVLPTLESEGPFDLVFIDADKERYPEYLDWAIRLTRPGAVILAHNAYLDGAIVADDGSQRVSAVRAFNRRLATDPFLASTIVPLRDGMSLSWRRDEAGP